MNTGQKQGALAIALGFILTTIAGLILAFLVNDTTGLLLSTGIAFLLIAPILGFGIYRYAQSTEEESLILADEMEKPRQLLDILRTQGQADIETLSQELGSSHAEIKTMIDDLARLELLSGIVNWDDGIIAMIEPDVLNFLEICKYCQNAITLKGSGRTICPHCGTEYYQV
jgi:hypothetical protein